MRKGALRVHCGLNSHVLLLLSRLPNVIGKRLRQFRTDTSRHYAVEERSAQALRRENGQRKDAYPRVLRRVWVAALCLDREHICGYGIQS